MRRLLIVPIVGLVLFGVVGCSPTEMDNLESVNMVSEINSYENNKKVKLKKIAYKRLEMRIPDGWKENELSDSMYMYKNMEGNTTLSIVKSESNVYISSEYFDKVEEYIQSVVKSSSYISERRKISKGESLLIKYDYSVNNGDECKVYQVHLVYDGDVYIITMLTKDKDIDTQFNIMDDIIGTVKF